MSRIEQQIIDNRPEAKSGFRSGTVIVTYSNRMYEVFVDDQKTIQDFEEQSQHRLVDYLPFINKSLLSDSESTLLSSIILESFAYSQQYWKPHYCHYASETILNHFADNPGILPSNISIILVTSSADHSWIEIVTEPEIRREVPRGKIIIDPAGLPPKWLRKNVPYFGHLRLAPVNLFRQYDNERLEYCVTLLDGTVYKTKDIDFTPWDIY